MKNRIKEIRTQKKITQDKIVRNMDITRQYISILEKSEIEPSMKVANGIATALGTCVYDVFDLDNTGKFKCNSCECCNNCIE